MIAVTIIDCRGKEKMEVSRYNGDVLLTFRDMEDNILFQFAMKMRCNTDENFEHIIKCFKNLKMYVEG